MKKKFKLIIRYIAYTVVLVVANILLFIDTSKTEISEHSVTIVNYKLKEYTSRRRTKVIRVYNVRFNDGGDRKVITSDNMIRDYNPGDRTTIVKYKDALSSVWYEEKGFQPGVSAYFFPMIIFIVDMILGLIVLVFFSKMFYRLYNKRRLKNLER